MLGMKINSLRSIVVVFPAGADDPGNVPFP